MQGLLPQVMKMMGLNNAVHWVAWFITGFVQLSISVTALTAILKYGKVLLHSDPFIIWLFLTVYAVATIMFWYWSVPYLVFTPSLPNHFSLSNNSQKLFNVM